MGQGIGLVSNRTKKVEFKHRFPEVIVYIIGHRMLVKIM